MFNFQTQKLSLAGAVVATASHVLGKEKIAHPSS